MKLLDISAFKMLPNVQFTQDKNANMDIFFDAMKAEENCLRNFQIQGDELQLMLQSYAEVLDLMCKEAENESAS